MSHQRGPDAGLIGSAEEDEEPDCCEYEAEDGHEHHPAQRVVWEDFGRGHQDPHQASKHLQGGGFEKWLNNVGYCPTDSYFIS